MADPSAPAARTLQRKLGTLDVFCIASGAMISSGLFVLPGLLFARIGPAVIIAYVFAGILVVPAMLAQLELATAMPKAGGSYFFIERSMGSVAGTIGGLANWFSLGLKSAFALVGLGAFATLLYPDLTGMQVKLLAIAAGLFFTVLNITSVKMTGSFQVFLVIGLLVLLVLYIIEGVALIDVHRLTPFFIGDRAAFLAAAGMAFISFGGLTKVASVAEDVADPSRAIPLGMIGSFVVVVLLYCLTVFVTVGVLDAEHLAGSLTPLSNGGKAMQGRTGSVAMAVAAILAFVSTANAGIMAASRFPLAMSRDRLAPRFLARLNRRFQTPHAAILLTGASMALVIFLFDLEDLVKVASTMMIVLFMFVLLASIVMRESGILNYKPTFSAPLYPWLHIAGLVAYLFVLYLMGTVALWSAVGFVIAGIAWHRVYVRGVALRKSALVHVVERITAKELGSESLATELRGILQERDDITEDRFDVLVKGCDIIDLHDSDTLETLFAEVSRVLTGRIDMTAEELHRAFMEREKESSTVLRPGLAVPHIIIPGEHKFELVIARSESGLTFAADQPRVYAIFVLLGSSDERNFHLRSLAAIAQIVQDDNFDKNWLRAKSIDELRDIILIAERHREKERYNHIHEWDRKENENS